LAFRVEALGVQRVLSSRRVVSHADRSASVAEIADTARRERDEISFVLMKQAKWGAIAEERGASGRIGILYGR
jgi:hypothetical protein